MKRVLFVCVCTALLIGITYVPLGTYEVSGSVRGTTRTSLYLISDEIEPGYDGWRSPLYRFTFRDKDQAVRCRMIQPRTHITARYTSYLFHNQLESIEDGDGPY